MSPAAKKIAPLLFGSGFCALIYQIAWTREFRLVFGASTAASAAVLAIFIGGLGVGGVWLGKRADEAKEPLFLYARLEALVAVLTALTPAFFWLIRRVYTGLGGTVTLGLGGGTILRLFLAALVLAAPTIAMGGTLPAAARAAETDAGEGRRGVALLYGINTLGAVTGCMLANFILLEVFGSRLTLWMACLVNLLVAVFAVVVSRDLAADAAEALAARQAAPAPDEQAAAQADAEQVAVEQTAPAAFVLAGAAVVGFAFFLMELIWYRMLGPILGGTVFTFGLILAVALLGIGAGGACYAIFGQKRPPTLLGFAYTCLLEGVLIILPFALGDRLALLALTLQTVGKLGFWGYVFGWLVVAGAVALPAAFVSGVQFPMLIALLGRGQRHVGRQIGLTYGWNTVGAAAGSLAGGFGLVPLIGAPGCWRLVAVLLGLLGASALALSLRRERRVVAALGPALLLVGIVVLQGAGGPTALWRHSGIGSGRFALDRISQPNGIESEQNDAQREIVWQMDGVESSVALTDRDAFSFIVNGKSDGNSVHDAGTQVMAGILGAALRPAATTAAVIGLGTGCTAGWLGVVPTLTQVDVFEIEPAIERVARDCAPVNQDVLHNPRVHLRIADAREVLQVTPQHYDIIFSEPSNPYRAGISSLFTREFYQSTAARMNPDAVFLQWVQGYEISPQTIRTIYATLSSVFPIVETWVLDGSDMLLVAYREPHPIDVARTRALLATEPYRTALAATWHTAGLEGMLGHHLGTPALAAAIAQQEGEQFNTDDHSSVEFGFARTLGRKDYFLVPQIDDLARARHENRPAVAHGEVNWDLVEQERMSRYFNANGRPPALQTTSPTLHQMVQMLGLSSQKNHAGVVATWRGRPSKRVSAAPSAAPAASAAPSPVAPSAPAPATSVAPASSSEPPAPPPVAAPPALPPLPGTLTGLAVLAEALASQGDEDALVVATALAAHAPLEAEYVRAALRAAQGKNEEAAQLLEHLLVAYRSTPWIDTVAERTMALALVLAQADRRLGPGLLDALSQPFAVHAQEFTRRRAVFAIALSQPDPKLCVAALAAIEPYPFWEEPFLRDRAACYNDAKHPLAAAAISDLQRYMDTRGLRIDEGLAPAP
jgi:predicted membrane-bound spermidine synthase